MRYKESKLYTDLLREPHLLVAGSTGSGKSVVENGIINSLCIHGSGDMILIDPKKTELYPWTASRFCVGYADNIPDILREVKRAEAVMDARFSEMRANRLRNYNGKDLYIFIDEYIDLAPQVEKNREVRVLKNTIDTALIRILSLGRAAKVHCVLCTQTPRARILTDVIRANLTSRVCLRTDTALESRVLMESKGCELLPRYGQGYVLRPGYKQLHNLSLIEDEFLENATKF